MDSGLLGVQHDKTYLSPPVNHCPLTTSTDTWLDLVSSNSFCCLQWNFHNPSSMSQNGSSNCLTNWADCLEPGVYIENHQPSCFFMFWQPGSSVGGRGTLHPGRSKGSFSLPFVCAFLIALKVLDYVQWPRSWWIIRRGHLKELIPVRCL